MRRRHCSIYIILMDHSEGIETPRRGTGEGKERQLRSTGAVEQR